MDTKMSEWRSFVLNFTLDFTVEFSIKNCSQRWKYHKPYRVQLEKEYIYTFYYIHFTHMYACGNWYIIIFTF